MKNILFFILLFATVKCTAQNFGNNITGINDNNGSLYWFGTTLISGANIAATTFNIIRIKKEEKAQKYKSNAIFGIISGSLQTIFGAAGFSGNNNLVVPASINIGIGASTIATSIIRLARKEPPKNTKISCNFFYVPKFDNTASVIGFHFSKIIN